MFVNHIRLVEDIQNVIYNYYSKITIVIQNSLTRSIYVTISQICLLKHKYISVLLVFFVISCIL